MKKLISVLILAVMLTANLMSVNCFASDEWIYYSNSKDIHRPYRIKSNGTEMARLSLETAYDLTPLGNYVYYHNNTEFGAIFRTKNDGSETEIIADGIREQCRGIAKNSRNVFVLYETNNNAGNREYAEPYLTLCIYDKKGECTKTDLTPYDLDSTKLVEIAGADNKYLYFSIKTADTISYKKMKINSDSGIQFKDCKETELPTMTEPAFDIPEGYFKNKYLCWKRADNAVAYRVFKMSGSDGKYKQIAETTDTFIDLCVKDTEYNDKFKVYAVKKKRQK